MVLTKTKTRLKLNNKGLSLVEVLVCVAILAIIFVPLMNTFMTSSRLNKKANDTQTATAFVQKIAEEFKTKTLEEMDASAVYSLIRDESVYLGLTPEQQSKYEEAAFTVLTYTKDSYEYHGTYYDVKVVLDPLAYSVTSTQIDAKDANTFEYPVITNIDAVKNPLIASEMNLYDGAAEEELRLKLPASYRDGGLDDKSVADIRLGMTKDIDISITGTTSLTVVCDITYSYTTGGNTYTVIYHPYEHTFPLNAVMDAGAFTGWEAGGNVYLFVTPYDPVGGIKANNLTIQNNYADMSKKINVYLIRGAQVGGATTANFTKVSVDGFATPYLDIADTTNVPTGHVTYGAMEFYSNIKTAASDISYTAALTASVNVSETKLRCYDITVTLYEQGTSNVAATVTSTKEIK